MIQPLIKTKQGLRITYRKSQLIIAASGVAMHCCSGSDDVDGGLQGILRVNRAWRVTRRSTTRPVPAADAAARDDDDDDELTMINAHLFFYNSVPCSLKSISLNR